MSRPSRPDSTKTVSGNPGAIQFFATEPPLSKAYRLSPRFFSVSVTSRDKAKLFQVAPGLLSGCRLDCPILFYLSTRFRESQVKAAVLALVDFKHGGTDSIKIVKHEGQ